MYWFAQESERIGIESSWCVWGCNSVEREGIQVVDQCTRHNKILTPTTLFYFPKEDEHEEQKYISE